MIELSPNRRLILEAGEIRDLTGWGDAMIVDYQGILQDLITVVDQSNDGDTDFQTQIDALDARVSNSEQLIAVLDTDKTQSVLAAMARAMKSQEQMIYAW